MVLYYKYYDAVIEKFKSIGEKVESKWWDWIDNVKDLFKDSKRYHFDCESWDKNSLYFHYYTSKNEYNLVSFNLWKESWKFKCNSALWFPNDCSEEKQNDVMYEVYRDCLEDLEKLEMWNFNE